jgi:TRAP-type uncharacterized transport system substrate-binding protein
MCPLLKGAPLVVALISLLQIDVAHAQAIPKSIQQGGNEYAIRERKNAWTVGIAGGLIDGTYMRFADELAKVLDDGDNLRILPIVSYGAASNLDDLLYLRGVDLAVTQSDVFEYFRTERKTTESTKQSSLHVAAPDCGTAHSNEDGYPLAQKTFVARELILDRPEVGPV